MIWEIREFKNLIMESTPKKTENTKKTAPLSPRPIQLNAGYYDVNGQFIPGGVINSPFDGKPFNISTKDGIDSFLAHLLNEYGLVIADTHFIADFQQYIDYQDFRKFKKHFFMKKCRFMKISVLVKSFSPNQRRITGQIDSYDTCTILL